MKYSLSLVSLAMIMLTACQNIPIYEKPTLALPDHYRSQDDSALIQNRNSQQIDWWKGFVDAPLTALLEQALINNLSLQVSEKSLAQANAFYQAQQAGFAYPKIDATMTGQSLRVNPSSLGQTGNGREFDLFQAGLTARYQLDLSGSQQQTLLALGAKTDHQQWQNQANRQSLIGQWLITAILIAKTQAQHQATQALVELQEEQVKIAQGRVALGLGQEVDVLALKSQLLQTQSTLPNLAKQQQQLSYLLASLTGISNSSGLPLQNIQLTQFSKQSVPLVIPSELVKKRPDILASEALVKAAHAEYGLALTRYYPSINLSASTGSQALSSAALFGSGTAVWSLLAQASQTLFDASLPEQERAALLGFETASLHYQQVILDAMRQVADHLSAIEQDQRSLIYLNEAENQAKSLIHLTEQQYRLGTASYLQLLGAQQQLTSIQLNMIQLKAQQLVNQVNLSVAVGASL
jgi:NodT family efflux transporter outer membrane factor (OMF) lipoprotein